jgi:hypothetical protein
LALLLLFGLLVVTRSHYDVSPSTGPTMVTDSDDNDSSDNDSSDDEASPAPYSEGAGPSTEEEASPAPYSESTGPSAQDLTPGPYVVLPSHTVKGTLLSDLD